MAEPVPPSKQAKTSTAAVASCWAMLTNVLDRAVSVLQLIRGSGMAVLVFGREAAPGLQHHTYPAVVGGKDEGPLLNHGERWSEASHMHLVDMESRKVKQGAQTARRGVQEKKVIALQ